MDHEHHHHHHGHREFDPDHLLAVEERRRTFMPPEEILGHFLTLPDENMVDLGCGAGYFTIAAARMLSSGIVYAIDRQQNMIDITLQRAAEHGLSNVRGLVASATNLPLSDHSADAFLMSMMFHDVLEQSEMLAEAKRVLKPEGTLYLVEWDQVPSDFGPPMEIRLRPDALTKKLQDAGFSIVQVQHSDKNAAVYYVHAQAPKKR